MSLELIPCFDVEAIFSNVSDIDDYGKRKLHFRCQCYSKDGLEGNFIEFDSAIKLGSALVCKVDEKSYQMFKYLLKPMAHLQLKVAPSVWKMDTKSGMTYSIVEIDNFGLPDVA